MKTFFLFLIFSVGLISNSELSKYFNNSQLPQIILLPNELYEISGITVDDDGNFFGHNDEEGIVYQIDFHSGKILNRIRISEEIIHTDFEDISFVDGKFYLLTSNGNIYSFQQNRNDFSYKIFETGLSEKFNCEGMMYEKKTNSFLIACKDFSGKKLNGFRAVYKFSLQTKKLSSKPFLLIDLRKLKEQFGVSQFHPSAIAYNESSDSYFILSAKGKPAILEISNDSKIIDAILLDTKNHPKSEGILFYQEKLFISDEGVNLPAQISIYSK